MYKNIYTTTVAKDIMLWQIKPYDTTGLPIDSIVFKGRTGIGGSTLEMLQRRHSILVVPTVSPIKGKCEDFRRLIQERNLRDDFNDMYGVMGEDGIAKLVKIKKIEHELKKSDKFIKIITTTDSFDCIIIAALNLGKLEWLYDNFFLLLDECHSFVTETFRPNITLPFRFFWRFTNKCLISATPFEFSDPAFAELNKHEILISEKLGEIELIEANDINGVVHFLLTHPDKFPANVHIFYNSITQLSERVKTALLAVGEIQCNIFCSKSDENIKKLGELSHLFTEEPNLENFKKFNFYTSKYTEAWDLHDTNATIILITDVKALHTKVGITNKGVQAIGRLRSEPNRIIHFTNHTDVETRTSTKFFKRKHRLFADDSITAFNMHAENAKAIKAHPYKKLTDAAEKYAEISTDGYSAKLEYIKIDQWVNHDACNEEYNNMQFIQQAWESCNYSVTLKITRPGSIPNVKNMLVEKQLELAYERIKNLEANKNNMLFSDDYSESQNDIVTVNKNFELMYKAYNILGPERILEIGFSKAALKENLNIANDEAMKNTVAILLKEKINKLPAYFTNKEAKALMLEIYEHIQYKSTCTGTEIDVYCLHFERNKSGIKIFSLKSD